MTRFAVLVSGGGTNLQALIDASPFGGGELALVVSSRREAFALERAKKAGIPTKILRPKDFPSREEYTDEVISLLQAEKIDFVILAGFLYILSPKFTEVFQNRVINVHPALIPAFCGEGFFGLRVHEAVLSRGVKLTGATVHFVNEITDGGPIISQCAIPVLPGDTPETLQKRVMEQCEQPLLVQAMRDICSGNITLNDGQVEKLR